MYAHPMAFYDMSDNLKELAAALKREAVARPHQVLAAVDGSPGSMGAVEYARDLVAAQGGKVVLVNVQPAPAVADARKTAERALCAAKAVLEAAGVAWKAEVEFGRRAQSILRCAERERCTLIVLGDSGRSAVAKFFMGALSHRVIDGAAVPVALVRRSLNATTYMPRALPTPFGRGYTPPMAT